MTDGLKCFDIYPFMTVYISQFKAIDFITFTSCKLSIELNEQILAGNEYGNAPYFVCEKELFCLQFLLSKFVVTPYFFICK